MTKSRSFLLLALLALACPGCAGPPAPPRAVAPAGGGIAGTVLAPDGRPAPGAQVYAYRSAKGGLRGPADFAAETDASGRYRLDLVAGSYHLVARLRSGGGEAGPPRPGDAWAVYPRNPVVVTAEGGGRADFRLQGVIQPHLLKEGSLAGGETGVRGRLVAGDGAPLAGGFVLAYRDADFRRMPDFTSAPSDADGRFVLYLPAGGRYCLAARTRTRGQPVAGEPYGQLGAGGAACREVAAGALLDVGTIRLQPFHSR